MRDGAARFHKHAHDARREAANLTNAGLRHVWEAVAEMHETMAEEAEPAPAS
jgi:hypothetical protein